MTTMKFGKTLSLAATVAMGLWGTASFAEMTQFQQLEQQVINDLATVGVSSVGIGMLTMAEVAQLSSILDSTDTDVVKAAAAKKLIETATQEPARVKNAEGTMQQEELAMNGLDSLGLSIPAGVTLSPSQLGQLAGIFADMDNDADKKAAAERVLADAMVKVVPTDRAGTMQLEEQLMNKLTAIGIEPPAFGTLTISQVGQLNAVFDGDDNDTKKKEIAMKILNM